MSEDINPCPTCTFLSLPTKEPLELRSARVTELLGRNDPLLDVELAEFRLVLQKAPETIQNLDQKIVQAKQLLKHLSRARRHAECRIADAKILLHPMRSLSKEIMTEIFTHCVAEDTATDSLDPDRAPWALARVCSRWRELALSLPRLWTTVSLSFDEHPDRATPRLVAYRLALLIERSQGLPLSVSISGQEDIEYHPILPLLEASISRWKDLYIRLPRSSIQHFSGNVFRSLRCLSLQMTGNLTAVDTFSFRSVPRLDTFQTNMITSPRAFTHVPLPWKQIRKVRGSTIDLEGLWYLEKMTNLEELEVTVEFEEEIGIEDKTLLPKLRRLSFAEGPNCDADGLRDFFSALEIPMLADLTVTFSAVVGWDHFFPELSIATTEKLTRLHISCGMSMHEDNTDNLLYLLSQTPRVEDFRISDKGMTEDFIAGLTVGSGLWGPMLMRLRILDFSDCFCDADLAEDISSIYTMLESRCLAPSAETNMSITAQPSGKADGMKVNMGHLWAYAQTESYLTLVRVPRWLFSRKDKRWKFICGAVKVECGVTMKDAYTENYKDVCSESGEEEE